MATTHDNKQWLKAVAGYMNLSLSELALKSGLAASTITRYMNDRSETLTITERSLDAIARFSGVARNALPGAKQLPGFGESEAAPYDSRTDERLPEWVHVAIEAARGHRNGVEAWIMKGWSLDLLGILPGDILIIDQNKRPRAGNIICAQLTDLSTGATETVMRRYEPPFIYSHSAKLGFMRPEQVDDERCVIMGVEDGIIRPRH